MTMGVTSVGIRLSFPLGGSSLGAHAVHLATARGSRDFQIDGRLQLTGNTGRIRRANEIGGVETELFRVGNPEPHPRGVEDK